MASELERSYNRTVRVLAPLRALYDDMCTAAGLLKFMPQIARYRVTDNPDEARIATELTLGPVSWPVEGTLVVRRTLPPRELAARIDIPSLQIVVEGRIELEGTAAEETQLTFAATIRSAHPLVRRMRSQLTGALEETVDTTTDRIAILARQHAEAERRLANSRNQERG